MVASISRCPAGCQQGEDARKHVRSWIRKELILHQAKAAGTLDSEYGCRTKLIGEVTGDIGKLFDQWDKFGWHRVTVYGDLKEPLTEFGKALGLKVIDEA